MTVVPRLAKASAAEPTRPAAYSAVEYWSIALGMITFDA